VIYYSLADTPVGCSFAEICNYPVLLGNTSFRNNKSANKKKAWQFPSFLLSEKMQFSSDITVLVDESKTSDEIENDRCEMLFLGCSLFFAFVAALLKICTS
jgi:hypothetical protein